MPHQVIIGLPRWHFTGPAVFAERLVRGLNALGHDARILLTESDCNLVKETIAEQPIPVDLPCDRLPSGADDSWGQRWEALERYLEERAPCYYLMLHDWRNNIVAPRLSRRIRLIGLVQADSELEIDQAARLGSYWDAIVSVSDPIHFKLAAKLSQLAPRLITIRNGAPTINAPPPKRTEGPLLIAYSGELRPHQKRLNDMVKIARRLNERGVDFQLTFFGDGAHRPALEEQSRDLTALGCVVFAGYLNNEALLNALANQHVFLLTSEFEGLSIALLEAMSQACVPVVSQLASQSLVIRDGINALTADVGDIDAFVHHLETLADDRSTLALLASRAFATIAEGGYRTQDMLANYLRLFKRIDASTDRGGYVRQRGPLATPRRAMGSVTLISGNLDDDFSFLDKAVLWPEALVKPHVQRRGLSKSLPAVLERHRVLVAYTSGSISGVDTFSEHLVRGLQKRGIDAYLHGHEAAHNPNPCGFPDEIPFLELPQEINNNYLGWRNRWQAMVTHLERLAPCIYLPNYNADLSCVAPQLSPGVRVVGIGHSDDPWHYEHLCRIGHACDALVGVSSAITDHLRQLAPDFSSRLVTIPYGVALSEAQADRNGAIGPHDARAPLRIIYSGRLIQQQKRALDIVAIARELAGRGLPFEMVVVGDGALRATMERAGHDLILTRKLWFTGAQPNSSVLELLKTCDAFLMPSSFEGLSVGMLEAMSRGVVPVVSDIRSGVPDAIVAGANGLVAPVGAIGVFADRLEWLWRNPADRARLAAAAIRTVEDSFRREQMIDRYVELFERIVADPLPRPCGPIVPPRHLAQELTWTQWARRIAADPAASVRRVAARVGGEFQSKHNGQASSA